MIRRCTATDASAVARIYNYYIRETVITFEEEPVSDAEMERRISEITTRFPWLVWEDDEGVVAYAYAARWKSRAAYRHSVEATIYLDRNVTGRGIGTRLYAALIAELRRLDIHCVVGGAALPNAASVALHEKLGFTKVAEFAEIGRKHGKWVNVAYWQLIL